MEDEKTEILDRIDDFRDAVKTIPSREILESEDVPTLLSRYEKIRQTLVTEDNAQQIPQRGYYRSKVARVSICRSHRRPNPNCIHMVRSENYGPMRDNR